MAKRKSKKPLVPIFMALWAQMQRNGHTPLQLSQELTLTYPYLMALARGERDVAGLKRDKLQRIAEYLDVSAAQAFLMSGILTPEDFEQSNKIATRVENTRLAMETDPDWRGFVPSADEWNELSPAMKMLLTLLYETVRHNRYAPANVLVAPTEKTSLEKVA